MRPRSRPRKANPRYNHTLKFEEWLPKRTDGTCRCGCGEKLEKRERVWRNGHDGPKVDEFMMLKGNSVATRKLVLARDGGICATCGMDTELERARARPGAWSMATPEEKALFEQRKAQGFPAGGTWWEADHIVPVVLGGTNTLDNFRTLCIACHKTATRQLAAKRARARRGAEHGLAFYFLQAPDDTVRANLPAPQTTT